MKDVIKMALKPIGLRALGVMGLLGWSCLVFGSVNAETIDPSRFGFAAEASAATNAVALQMALTGGNRTVHVNKPGVYLLDRTVFLDDNTVLSCAKGVVFKKVGRYPQVLLNRAAFDGGTNVNITIRGIELRCNEQDMIQDVNSPAPNLRGQVAFVRAKDIHIQDFTCREYGLVGSCQYCLQFVGFERLLVEDFDIEGGKDAIHLDYGRDFVIRNGRLRSGDDGVALNAGDWPGGVTPLMGSITDGIIENVEDMPGGRWNFIRVITGVWMDWHKGMRLQADDMVRVGNRIYCVWPMPRKRLESGAPIEWRSDTMPTHAFGVWKSPEGINFQFLQDDGNVRADITNVVIRNCRMNADRGVFCAWEINDYARLIHPEIPHSDYPKIDIRIENCIKTTKTPLVYGCASAHVVIDNVRCAGPLANLHRLPENWPEGLPSPYYADRTLVVENCKFEPGDGIGSDIIVDDPRGRGTARIVLRRNQTLRPVVVDSSVPGTKIEGDTPHERVRPDTLGTGRGLGKETEPKRNDMKHRFPWRGFLLDEARHFFGKATVKDYLDHMQRVGINRFHWHLADDQGWRIDVPGYPELVKYGGQRASTPKDGQENISDGIPYGPFFYKPEDIREIVDYAALRQIEVIPEIEIPGHVRAFLAAHPEFSCAGDLSREAWNEWGVCKDVVCAGNDDALAYYERVVDEVMKMFPSGYFHLGGDECPKDRWKVCPKCQSRIRELGLKDEASLQGWLVTRVARHVSSRGKRAICWDEILACADVPTNIIIQCWRDAKYVADAVKRGHEVIVSPFEYTYFTFAEGLPGDPYHYRSWTGGESLPAAKIRLFDPLRGVPTRHREKVIGGECCLWSEFVHDRRELDYKVLSRLASFGEAMNNNRY